MRLLIVSAYFWPEQAGTAPYITGMARHLAKAGHHIDVIAAHPHYPAWRPMGSRCVLCDRLNGIAVRRRPHYIPRSQSAAKRALYEGSMLCAFTAALPATPRPDAVLGVVPALSSGVVARLAHRLYRRPYGLLVHDLIGLAVTQSGVQGGERVAELVTRAETYAAEHASCIGIIADGFRPYFESMGIPGDRIERLRTWSLGELEERGAARESFGWNERHFVCLHAGNMGYKQDLDNLLEAARETEEDSLLFVLAGNGSEGPRLRQRTDDLALPQVSFLDSQPEGRYEQMLESADVLLINQRASVTEMSLPSKLTSYFAAARPIVAAVPPDSETASEVRAADAGVVVPPGDPAALVNAILELKRDPRRGETLGCNGRKFALANLGPESVLPTYERFVQRIKRSQ